VLGKHEKAAKLFEQATKVRPEDYQAAIYLVGAYNDSNLKNEAKRANQRALEVVRNHIDLNPDDARALYLGAWSLIKANKREEALDWVEMAVTLDPKEISILYNAACVYSLLGKFEIAINFLEKAFEAGFASAEWIENDSDFDPIRNHPRFLNALKKIEDTST
jgi:adenylate cyclase